jgi:hypothetical protein
VGVELYPNPSATGNFVLAVACTQHKATCTLRVFDITGKLVYNTEANLVNNQAYIPALLRTGLYLVEITVDNDAKFSKKLLVE